MKLDHDGFAAFWASYPKKLAKLDAMKAYTRARHTASAEDILAGVQRYREHMPDELRYVAHAASWLRAGRWMDEYDTPLVKPQRVEVDWYQECGEMHGGACGLDRWKHHTRKMLDKAKSA